MIQGTGKSELVELPSVVADSRIGAQQADQSKGPARALAATFVAMFCLVGIGLWGLPFYYDFMVQQFGWSRAQVTSGNAIGKLLIGPVFGFLAGWIVDRFGPRRLMIAGVLMGGIAVAGLGRITSLSGLYFFYSLNALAFVCGGPLPAQVLISRWFVRSRGKAMGIAYLGIGFGGAAVPWISNSLVKHFGWQTALQLLGGFIIVLALPFALMVKDAPLDKSLSASSSSADIRTALKTLPFALLVVGSMCSIAAVSGTQQNMKLFLSLDRQYSQSNAAQIISLVLACSIVGRILMGWLADRFPKKLVMLLIYLLVATAIPFLFLSNRPIVVAVAAALFGIGLGGDYMILPLVTAEIFGIGILGRLMGIIVTAGGVAEAASPWMIGRLRDATGSYVNGCFLLIGLALLGGVAALALPKGRSPA
jgi:sugar phosphate permease